MDFETLVKLKREKYCYTSNLYGLLRKSSVEFVTQVHQAIDFYIDQYESYIRDGANSQSIAYSFHKFVDSTYSDLKGESKKSFDVKSCKKGCNFCCSNPVVITNDESNLIWTYINSSNTVIDIVKITNQIGRGENKWFSLSKEDRKCVFLGADGLCSIYEYRPLACRKYHVISDAADCELMESPGPVQILINNKAEIVSSAAMTAVGSGFMADLLVKKMTEGSNE